MLNNTYKDNLERWCKTLHEECLESIQNKLWSYLNSEFHQIHAKHFKRHRLRFIDSMGVTLLRIGNKDVDSLLNDDSRLISIFKDLNDLLQWYITLSGDFNMYIGDINIKPQPFIKGLNQ